MALEKNAKHSLDTDKVKNENVCQRTNERINQHGKRQYYKKYRRKKNWKKRQTRITLFMKQIVEDNTENIIYKHLKVTVID